MPAFGKLKLATIPRGTIQSFIDRLGDEHSASTARQCRIILHAIYVFAQRHEITEKNPCQFITVAAQSVRERVLSDDELKAIWQALEPPVSIQGASISPGVAYAIKLAMVTLQRRGEITGMRVDELDLQNKLWTIPSSRTKNHRTHVVPLSDLAVELLEGALAIRGGESEYLFPSPRNVGKPIEPHAMTRAFGRLKTALGLQNVRPRDLRRTGATNLTGERLGFPRFTISRVLNHASDTGGSAVTGIYDQNPYLPEKRRALDAWAMRLREIVSGEAAGENVVNLL
jgi:integrase